MCTPAADFICSTELRASFPPGYRSLPIIFMMIQEKHADYVQMLKLKIQVPGAEGAPWVSI